MHEHTSGFISAFATSHRLAVFPSPKSLFVCVYARARVRECLCISPCAPTDVRARNLWGNAQESSSSSRTYRRTEQGRGMGDRWGVTTRARDLR